MPIQRKRSLGFAVVVVVALTLGEVFARFHLGLGTPPLYAAHPTIEYMYRPNQDVQRFGNRFATNRYGMRSNPFPADKPQGEYRLLVFGDSVLNGGNLTDQQELATQIVANELASRRHAPIVVGNVSAGSWGPGNWLAYAREYGFFDADAVVLVVSSHDYADNPTFHKLSPDTHPTRAPLSALTEGVSRYLPRYLRPAATPVESEPDTASIQRGLADLKAFLELARQPGRTVIVMQYLEKQELVRERMRPGYALIQALCDESHIEHVDLAPHIRRAMTQGVEPYRDNLHPNAEGQRVLADALIDVLSRSTTSQ